MIVKTKNRALQTQGLGNTPYSLAHQIIFQKEDRLRVAKQLLTILQEHTGKKYFKDWKLLDIGCASGIITQYLASYVSKAIGIDIDEHAISIARKNYSKQKNLTFEIASGSKIPYENNFFDLVVCNQVYSYTSAPKKLLTEIYRVLKPGGICIFTGDNLLWLIENQYKLPFLHYLPRRLAEFYLKIFRYDKFYLGKYKTYWGIIKLFNRFKIEDYTLRILKNPENFGFNRLLKYKTLVNMFSDRVLKLIEPFLPTFVFILKKPVSED